MQRTLLALAAALAASPGAWPQSPGEVRGSVVDARGGEPLARVEILLAGSDYRAVSDARGRFRISGIAPGQYTLQVSTVGYHLAKREFRLEPGEAKEFEVILSPDTLRQTETVVARAGPFEPSRQDSPSTLVLAGNDAKNLAGVLADDPLRAVQSLPGVASNNDFDARFSVRGADYTRVGVYLDGVLLHEPFHTLEGQNISGSGTAFNGDMVEEMELAEGAFPARFADRSGSTLDVRTREGSRSATTFRAFGSASNGGAIVEGPLGKGRHGSWLAGARKSYLQYILERTFPDTSLIFGMEDAQGRIAYDLTPRHSVTLYLLESFSGLDRSAVKSRLGINSLMTGGYHYTLANFGWRYTPSDRWLIVSRTAWMREKWDDSNPAALALGTGYYGEWVWNGSVTWMWNRSNPLEAGWSARRLRDSGFENQFQSLVSQPRLLQHFDATSARAGGHVQQSWMAWSGRLHLTAGARWDRDSLDGVAAVSPSASAALAVTPATRIQIGWGHYVQFPELSILGSPLGGARILPLRSIHTLAAVERRLGARTRLRAEFYNRADRDLPFQPLFDPRILSGKMFAPPLNTPFWNSLRGYARGFEVFVERHSANRATGWVSYSYGRTEMRDGLTGQHFPSDWDQRHTVNVYGGYRVSPSVNLSVRATYGSGFPIPGYLRQSDGAYYLAGSRNQLRLPHYQRTDVRVNKAWTKDRWKLTLYGEVINLTNRTNYIFDVMNGYNSKSGQANVQLDTLFPVLPSAGLVFER
jgi:hypothetical protein